MQLGGESLLKHCSVPLVVEASAGADAAARTMQQRHVGSLVVVRDGVPVGLVTDRDIALGALRRAPGAPIPRVGDLASTPLRTLPATSSLAEATAFLGANSIRRVGLTGADGTLIGVLASDALLLALGTHVEKVAHTIRREFREERAPTGSDKSIFGTE